MRVFTDLQTLPQSARGAVVALGNFDGVHPGHQAVITEAAVRARASKAHLAVLTFSPHPRQYFQPDLPPFRLSSEAERRRKFSRLGVDILYQVAFDEGMATCPAQRFIDEVLDHALGVACLVVGEDFRFGQGRGGTLELLRQQGAAIDMEVVGVAPVTGHDGERIASTRIRQLLMAGQISTANIILGHPYELDGVVQRGDQRGRTIGFPTLNLDLGDRQRPHYGVYAVRVGVADSLEAEAPGWTWHTGIANIGKRPTVDGLREWLEVFVFDFDQDAYGKAVRVQLLEFLRPEQRFEGLDALKTQISEDIQQARRVLTDHPLIALPFA